MSPRRKNPRRVWTPDEVRELAAQGTWTTVAVAGEIFGWCPSAANHAVHRGDFPVHVEKLSGRRWVVSTADIVRVLKLDTAEAEAS